MRNIEHLNQSREELKKKRKFGEELIKSVVNYTGNNLDPIVNRVLAERVVIDETLKKIAESIKSIQDICDHDKEYVYHDSHYRYYTCKKCGKIDKV
jgi:hypothetical protein